MLKRNTTCRGHASRWSSLTIRGFFHPTILGPLAILATAVFTALQISRGNLFA
ncbi:hypothetical protein V6Z12_D11G135200 [Gossypium hirsutum]